jgi:hypothetical protein
VVATLVRSNPKGSVGFLRWGFAACTVQCPICFLFGLGFWFRVLVSRTLLDRACLLYSADSKLPADPKPTNLLDLS